MTDQASGRAGRTSSVDTTADDLHSRRIVIIEDDESVRKAAAMVLESVGFDVSMCANGSDAMRDDSDITRHDLVLLDLMLPGASGFEVCRRIRERSGIPIVMLTARSDPADVVAGLELGADDYVTKPFDPAVLVARIRAVLRRHTRASDAPARTAVRDVLIDDDAACAYRDGGVLRLSVIEFRLLGELVRSAVSVLTRDQLLERVWGYDYLGDSRLVDMAVMRLRDKLGSPTDDGIPYISTVRGIGYRFES